MNYSKISEDINETKKIHMAAIIFSISVFLVFAEFSIPVIRQIINKTPEQMKAEAYLENKYKLKFRAKGMVPERTIFLKKTGKYNINVVPVDYEGVRIRLSYYKSSDEFSREEIIERGTKDASYEIRNMSDFWSYVWSEEISGLIEDDVLDYFGDCYFYAMTGLDKSAVDSIESQDKFISFFELIEKYKLQEELSLKINAFGLTPDEKMAKDFKEHLENKYSVSFKYIRIYYWTLEDKKYFDDFFEKGHNRFVMGRAEGIAVEHGSEPVAIDIYEDKIERSQYYDIW